MDSTSLAMVPSRGRDIAEALSHALGRRRRETTGKGRAPPRRRLSPCCRENAAIRNRSGAGKRTPLGAAGSSGSFLPSTIAACLESASASTRCVVWRRDWGFAPRPGRATTRSITNSFTSPGSRGRESRRLDRYLEEKFARALRAFRVHRDEATLRKGWEQSLDAEDDLGGSYFALLTHPALEKTLAQEAMGHVHMLSHVAASALRRVRAELERARAHGSLRTSRRRSSANGERGYDRRTASCDTASA